MRLAGIDIGGTKIHIAIGTADGSIVADKRLPMNPSESAEAMVDRIVDATRELAIRPADSGRIAAVAVCCPGPIDYQRGVILDPANIPNLHGAPLRDLLQERFAVPVDLEHDAKAAALGEYWFGGGSASGSMVYIVIGTGVGAGIILDGEIYRGERNYAGEIGHVSFRPDGPVCSCGSHGCVELYLAGPDLVDRYRQGGSVERSEDLTAIGVVERARNGEQLAGLTLSDAGEALGFAVATTAMILDVTEYVIGGSVAKADELLLQPARRAVPRYSYASVAERVTIRRGQLGGRAPLVGCLQIARLLISAGTDSAEPAP